MNAIQLTKKLISIPSFVDQKTNEKQVAEFIFNYLKNFDFLKIKKQKVDNSGRFNIIAQTKGAPKLLLAGHMDTAQPKKGWKTNQLKPIIKNNKIYGLGAGDMKAGIACILSSLQQFKDVQGLTLLFYCDEEYRFQGMKKFTAEYKNKKLGTLAVIAEPSQLKIWNAHRGVIEISLAIKGKTGHSAHLTPSKNAIKGMTLALQKLERWLGKNTHPTLGKNLLNISYIHGGLNLGLKNNKIQLGAQGNNVADYAEARVEIRTVKKIFNAKSIKNFLQKFFKENGYQMTNFTVINNFANLYTPPNKLKKIEKIVQKIIGKYEYVDPSSRGFGDGQILSEETKIPVVYFGPNGNNTHAANEWVDIASISKTTKVFAQLIQEYCKCK